jgi:hypothetical protein
MARQWVVATVDKTQFIGFSCSSLGPLDKANMYLSEDNANKKIKQLYKYNSDYPDLIAVRVRLVIE